MRQGHENCRYLPANGWATHCDGLTPEMVRRYAHLTAEHLAPYADRLSALRVVENAAEGRFYHSATNEIGLRQRKPLTEWRARQDESGHWKEITLAE